MGRVIRGSILILTSLLVGEMLKSALSLYEGPGVLQSLHQDLSSGTSTVVSIDSIIYNAEITFVIVVYGFGLVS